MSKFQKFVHKNSSFYCDRYFKINTNFLLFYATKVYRAVTLSYPTDGMGLCLKISDLTNDNTI